MFIAILDVFTLQFSYDCGYASELGDSFIEELFLQG